jgi:hypothetical protein
MDRMKLDVGHASNGESLADKHQLTAEVKD